MYERINAVCGAYVPYHFALAEVMCTPFVLATRSAVDIPVPLGGMELHVFGFLLVWAYGALDKP